MDFATDGTIIDTMPAQSAVKEVLGDPEVVKAYLGDDE